MFANSQFITNQIVFLNCLEEIQFLSKKDISYFQFMISMHDWLLSDSILDRYDRFMVIEDLALIAIEKSLCL